EDSDVRIEVAVDSRHRHHHGITRVSGKAIHHLRRRIVDDARNRVSVLQKWYGSRGSRHSGAGAVQFQRITAVRGAVLALVTSGNDVVRAISGQGEVLDSRVLRAEAVVVAGQFLQRAVEQHQQRI